MAGIERDREGQVETSQVREGKSTETARVGEGSLEGESARLERTEMRQAS